MHSTRRKTRAKATRDNVGSGGGGESPKPVDESMATTIVPSSAKQTRSARNTKHTEGQTLAKHPTLNSSPKSHVSQQDKSQDKIDTRLFVLKENQIDYLFAYLLTPVLAAICYHNALDCGLVFDDTSAITNNKDLRPTTPWWRIFEHDFWGTPLRLEYSHKSYRPLTVMTFRSNYALNGLDPFGYHAVNVMLYALICERVYWLARDFMDQHASIVATLLFIVHPVHSEAVTGVVGRAELLMSFFALWAFKFYRQSALTASKGYVKSLVSLSVCSLLTVMSFLSKEQAVSIIPLCITYEILVLQDIRISIDFGHSFRTIKQKLWGRPIIRCAAMAALGVIILATRFLLMGRLPSFSKFDNPAAHSSDSLTRILTFNYYAALNAFILIFPKDLLCDWTMGTIPLVEHLSDHRNLATVIFYLTLTALLYATFHPSQQRQIRNALIVAISISVYSYLPASNAFVYVGFVIAERILFMPSLGFCLAFGLLWSRYVYSRKQSEYHSVRNITVHILLTIVLVLCAYRTYSRNFDWKSEYTLFSSGLQVTKSNAKLYNNLGFVFEKQGDLNKALEYYKNGANVQHDDIGSHINIGRVMMRLNESDKAYESYERARNLLPKSMSGKTYEAQVAPQHLNVLVQMAKIKLSRHSDANPTKADVYEAISLLQGAIRMRPDYVEAVLELARLLHQLNETKRAMDVLLTALKYLPDHSALFYNMGVISGYDQNEQQAIEYYEQTLRLDPAHPWAKYALALTIILSDNKTMSAQRIQEARKYLLDLSADRTTLANQYSDYGALAKQSEVHYWLARTWLISDGGDQVDKLSQAEHHLRSAILYDPNHIDSLLTLSELLLTRLKQYNEARHFAQQVIDNIDEISAASSKAKLSRYVKASQLSGEASYLLKDYEQARTRFAKILDVSPEDTLSLKRLCDMRHRLSVNDATKLKCP